MAMIEESKVKRRRIDFVTVKQVREHSGLYNVPHKITNTFDAHAAIITVFDLANDANEKFGVIALDTKNKINGLHILSEGTLDQSLVHPREVFKQAILNNASQLILFHNHPSGDPTPSKEDIAVTKRMVECGDLMGIEVLDHIIVGDRIWTSLKEQGHIS